MDQSANNLVSVKMQRTYDSESTISSLERARIDEHIKKIEMKYKDLNLTRKKAIIEMRRGGRIGKVDLTKSKGNSSENDAASEHKKPSEVEIKIRPPPDVRVKSIITYQLCKHVTRYGRCNRGDECVFAHSKEELKVWEEVLAEKRSKIDMPTKLKHILSPRMCPPCTDKPDVEYKMCSILYKNDFCHFGDKCRFAHSSEELLLWRALKKQGMLRNKPKLDDNTDGVNTKNRKSPTTNYYIERVRPPRSEEAIGGQYWERSPRVSTLTQLYPQTPFQQFSAPPLYWQNHNMSPPGHVNYPPFFDQQYFPVT